MRHLVKVRFSLRLLLIGMGLTCIALSWFWVRPRHFAERQRSTGRSLIHGRDQVYLTSCFDQTVNDHLITVLGDSRLTHWDSVSWMACPDTNTVISFGRDNALLVWNRQDGSIRQGFYDVSCASYAADRRQVIWADAGGQVFESIIGQDEVSTEMSASRLPPVQRPRLLCTADSKYLVHTGSGAPITVWGPDLKPVTLATGEEMGLPHLCMPDNQSVVVTDAETVFEFELSSGQLRSKVPIPPTPDGHAAGVNAAAISPDGSTLYLGDAAGRVLAFDWTRKEFREEFISTATSIRGLAARDMALHVASDSLRTFTWYGEPRRLFLHPRLTESVEEVANGPPLVAAIRRGRIVSFDGDPIYRMQGGARADATCFAFSPTGNYIALAGRDGQIVIRETAQWELVRSWKAHEGWIQRLVWSPAENQLASVGDDQTVVWDQTTGKELWTAPLWSFLAKSVTFDNTGKRLAIRDRGFNSVAIYDTADFVKRQSVPRSASSARGDMLFSGDGKLLFMGADSGAATVWSLDDQRLLRAFGKQKGGDASLEIARDGTKVFVAQHRSLTAYDFATGATIWTLAVHSPDVRDLARHPFAPVLATAGSDGTVGMIDANNGTLIRRLRLGPAQGKLVQIDFSPDGTLLAVAMNNGAVIVMESMVNP